MGSNRTVGVSPKASVPTLVLLALGVALAVADLTGLLVVDDTLWQALLGAGGVAGVSGYAAPPGDVVQVDPDPDAELRDLHEAV